MHTNQKKNFSYRKKSLDLCACGILDPRCSSRSHKIS